MVWPQLLVITTLSVLITSPLVGNSLSTIGQLPPSSTPNPPKHAYHTSVYLAPTKSIYSNNEQPNQQLDSLNSINQNIVQHNNNAHQGESAFKARIKSTKEPDAELINRQQIERMLYQQAKLIDTIRPRQPALANSGRQRGYIELHPAHYTSHHITSLPSQNRRYWKVGNSLPAMNSEESEIVIEHMQTAASGDGNLNNKNNNNSNQQAQINNNNNRLPNNGLSNNNFVQRLTYSDKSLPVINARRYNNKMNQQQLDSLLEERRRYKKNKSIQVAYNRLGQLNSNASFEDVNWRIATTCLRSHFGSQYVYNKDVKCASSQVVLSISRMQRAACKSCESYFHCEAFSNVMKYCKNNYDVQETIQVVKDCKDLFILGDDDENSQAAEHGYIGIDCQQSYLCKKNCMYNPSDKTCPRNNCMSDKFGKLPKWQYMGVEIAAGGGSHSDDIHDKGATTKNAEEKGRAFPKDPPPMRASEIQRIHFSAKQLAKINDRQDFSTKTNRQYQSKNTNTNKYSDQQVVESNVDLGDYDSSMHTVSARLN